MTAKNGEMLGIDVDELAVPAIYKLLVGAVVPRPIAWVTTLNPVGKVNLAPFSFFTVVSVDPPILLVNSERRVGLAKDTPLNAKREGELVINIVTEELAWPMHQSSAAPPPNVSETELLGIALAPSVKVRTPRVTAAPIAIECRLERLLEVGRAPSDVIFAEALYFHVRADLIADGKIDMRRLHPLARLAGLTYARLGEIMDLPAVGDAGAVHAIRSE